MTCYASTEVHSLNCLCLETSGALLMIDTMLTFILGCCWPAVFWTLKNTPLCFHGQLAAASSAPVPRSVFAEIAYAESIVIGFFAYRSHSISSKILQGSTQIPKLRGNGRHCCRRFDRLTNLGISQDGTRCWIGILSNRAHAACGAMNDSSQRDNFTMAAVEPIFQMCATTPFAIRHFRIHRSDPGRSPDLVCHT